MPQTTQAVASAVTEDRNFPTQAAEASETSVASNSFKETHLGSIPVEWEMVRIGEVAKVKYGKAKPRTDGPVPVVGSGGVYAWTDAPLVEFPTLVIGRKGTAGQVWLMEQPCWPADTTFYLEWKQSIDVAFLFGYLTLKPLSGQHAKTTLPSLQRPDLEHYLVPLPPLPEQRRIAHVLSTIQQAIAAQDDLIAATREVKRSLMRHLFTYGPSAEPAPSKQTHIGAIPVHWEVGTLEDVKAPGKGAIVSGPFGSNIGKRFFVESGIPVIRGNNLTKGEALFVDSGFVFVTEKKAQELANCTALPGDLVFTAAGTIGQVGLIPENCSYPKYIISNKQLRARVDTSRTDPLYLFYWFTHDRMQTLTQIRRRGTSIPVINLGILRNLPVAFPPLSQQREIAHMLSAADRKLQAEEQHKAALQALFKSMLHRLMTGQLRVPDSMEVPQ
jgi:type I restriction enzyme S subunit